MQYHPYKQADPFRIPESADKLLNEYWDITESLGIGTCLLAGTCLGFVRDGGYIIGDNDIDVWISDKKEELIINLLKNGFICRVYGEVNIHFLKYNLLLDVFFVYPFPEFLKSFDEIKYNGRVYNVPHPVEDYLTKWYGDWKTIKLREEWSE